MDGVYKKGGTVKTLYHILRIVLWSSIGVFIGSSVFTWYDYKTHPGLYEIQSAPWYLGIQVYGIYTLVTVVIVLLLMWMIRKKIK